MRHHLQRITSALRSRHRSRFASGKLSFHDLRGFLHRIRTDKRTLIVYIEVTHDDLIPNAVVLPHFETDCTRYFKLLAEIPDHSFEEIIAFGILEHLPDPRRLLDECHRILAPGGRLHVSASAVFCVHRGPDDYFHVTQFGMRELLRSRPWANLDIRGSCGPFKCVGMMLERILLQCETRSFIRPFVEALAYSIPQLDRFVLRQYCDRSFSEPSTIDSMMPSNIQMTAVK